MTQNSDPYQPLAQSLPSGDRVNGWILARPRKKIVQMLKGQRVLDTCCGTGNLAALLAEAGCRVVGVDSSATMIAFARKKQLAVEFWQMDAERLPFEGEFDAAVISIALHEMAPQAREQVWESMRRAVRPGGCLVALDFAVPARDHLLARVAGGLIEQDERSIAGISPAHYENFREFMRAGGLIGWMQKGGQRVAEEYRFLAGTLAVVVVRPDLKGLDATQPRDL